MESVKAGDVLEKLRRLSLPDMSGMLLDKCAVLCNKYGISVDDLLNKMDAFLLTQSIPEMNLETFGRFEQDIQGSNKHPIRDRNVRAEDHNTNSPDLKRKSVDYGTPVSTKSMRSNTSTPDSIISSDSRGSNISFSQAQANGGPSGVFQTRKDFGQILVKFNEDLPIRGTFEPSQLGNGMRCRIEFTDSNVFENVTQHYRYMFTTLEERARALDEHMLRLQADMCAAIGLREEDLAPVGIPSPEKVWVCGRICNDSMSGKINKTSLLLEGSRIFSGGRRVELDVQSLSQYAVFPGQIVLVYGINASGRRMVAEKMIEGIPKKHLSTSNRKLTEFHYSKLYQNGKALNIVVACGPFSTVDNLEYEPFNELLEHVATSKPDVLILVGPFVDASNHMIQEGDAMLIERGEDENPIYGKEHYASFETVFWEKVMRDGFNAYFNSAEDYDNCLPTQIILVPSLLDAHHECVFPQPPFGEGSRIEFDMDKNKNENFIKTFPFSSPNDSARRMYLAPNPCMFRINEILFGVTSNDTMFALSSDQDSVNPGHRMCRMAGHMLQQQSFSPSFPPPPTALAQLDLRQSKHWQMNASPDVLIAPSRLTPLAKDVLDTLVINPGTLAKGVKGGSYATLSINPMSSPPSSDEGENMRPHNVAARTNVSICKI